MTGAVNKLTPKEVSKIRELKQRHNISNRLLSSRFGVSISTISKAVNGKRGYSKD